SDVAGAASSRHNAPTSATNNPSAATGIHHTQLFTCIVSSNHHASRKAAEEGPHAKTQRRKEAKRKEAKTTRQDSHRYQRATIPAYSSVINWLIGGTILFPTSVFSLCLSLRLGVFA